MTIYKSNVSFNVHSHIHLSQQVSRYGPLHKNSCFAFEGVFKVFKAYIHGFNSVPSQINEYLTTNRFVQAKLREFKHTLVDQRMINFIESLKEVYPESKSCDYARLDMVTSNALIDAFVSIGYSRNEPIAYYQKIHDTNSNKGI